MSASQAVIAPMLVALSTAIATLLARGSPRIQRGISVLGSVAYLGAVGVLAERVFAGGTLVYQVSDWSAPFGITLVADGLSAFMLALAAVVSLAAVAFSAFYIGSFGQQISYHSLYHFMLLGVSGAFLTGDIFNLFVWFEVMLMPSFVFVVFYSGRQHTRAALLYVVLNLVGSAVMLVAIGGLYATTGTLNMADMANRLANASQWGIDPTPVLGLSALLFAVFALKAGIVPFQFWVPAAYRAAPAPISAVLAGVTKKVGVYAIIRLYFTVFAAASLPAGLDFPGLAGESFLAFFGPVLFLMATASIVLGGLGAINQPDLDGVFAYSSIGQVGFIILPLGIVATIPDQSLRVLGIVAALVYSLNHAVAKSVLFMASGAIHTAVGSIKFQDLGGLTSRTPVLSASFLVGGLALVGIPPLAGFFGKLLVFDTAGSAILAESGALTFSLAGSAVRVPYAAFALAVALGGAILTIAYVSRTWNRGFWGAESESVARATKAPALVTVVAALALTLVVLGIGFDPVLGAAETAADAALDSQGYVDAVDPTTATEQLDGGHGANASSEGGDTAHQVGVRTAGSTVEVMR